MFVSALGWESMNSIQYYRIISMNLFFFLIFHSKLFDKMNRLRNIVQKMIIIYTPNRIDH